MYSRRKTYIHCTIAVHNYHITEIRLYIIALEKRLISELKIYISYRIYKSDNFQLLKSLGIVILLKNFVHAFYSNKIHYYTKPVHSYTFLLHPYSFLLHPYTFLLHSYTFLHHLLPTTVDKLVSRDRTKAMRICLQRENVSI